MTTARLAVPALLVLSVLVGGCGGDGGGEEPGSSLSQDEQTAADNLAAQITRSGSMSQQGSGEDAITQQQATCVAEGAVEQVGLKELQDYGIVTEDLLVNKGIQGVRMRAEHADALAGVFVECLDAEALFEERFLGAMPGGSSAERRECVEEAVDEAAVRKVLAASFEGRETDAYATMQKRVSSCAGGTPRGQ